MKDGIFAIYMGNEYEVGLKEDGSFILRSQNSKDLANGFTLYKGVIYIKVVQRSELEEVYKIRNYATYQGYKFGVEKEDGDKLLLHTGDYTIYQKLNLEMVDRGVYNKWVSKNDVTSLYEEKTPF